MTLIPANQRFLRAVEELLHTGAADDLAQIISTVDMLDTVWQSITAMEYQVSRRYVLALHREYCISPSFVEMGKSPIILPEIRLAS